MEICNLSIEKCLECERESCRIWDNDPEIQPNIIIIIKNEK